MVRCAADAVRGLAAAWRGRFGRGRPAGFGRSAGREPFALPAAHCQVRTRGYVPATLRLRPSFGGERSRAMRQHTTHIHIHTHTHTHIHIHVQIHACARAHAALARLSTARVPPRPGHRLLCTLWLAAALWLAAQHVVAMISCAPGHGWLSHGRDARIGPSTTLSPASHPPLTRLSPASHPSARVWQLQGARRPRLSRTSRRRAWRQDERYWARRVDASPHADSGVAGCSG